MTPPTIATHSMGNPAFGVADLRNRSLTVLLGDLILGKGSRQRATTGFLFLTIPVFLILLYMLFYGAQKNLFNQTPLVALAQCWAIYLFCLYAFMRSGMNQYLDDPTMGLTQTCIGQTFMAGIYALTGPVHAGALLIMGLIMMFAMFNMKKQSTNISCIYTIVLIGATALYKANTDPLNYPPEQEWIYFVLASTTLTVISRLTIKLAHLRHREKIQRRDLESAYLHIHQMATRDELTGLCNRRQLKTLLEEHVERQVRYGQNFYLAMIDIDHFKRVNDTYGHHIGDEVLIGLARCTGNLLRKTDVLGRWGGEEFLLLLPETSEGQVPPGLSRLHAFVAQMPMVLRPPLFVTFSAGLTKYRRG